MLPYYFALTVSTFATTSHRPNIIITDFSMPQMSGFQLIRQIRETDKVVHIIATSALFHRQQEAELMRRIGANICLAKPVDLSLLEKTINRLLGH